VCANMQNSMYMNSTNFRECLTWPHLGSLVLRKNFGPTSMDLPSAFKIDKIPDQSVITLFDSLFVLTLATKKHFMRCAF
jgi:hypothetical protein